MRSAAQRWSALLLWVAGCADPSAEPAPDDACDIAQQRRGHRACVHTVSTASWPEITQDSVALSTLAQTKFLLPARDDARVSPLFLDANHELDHYSMLTETLPERFGGMTLADYGNAITNGLDREFFAGPIAEYRVAGQTRVYGYTIWDDLQVPSLGLTCPQLRDAEATLSARFEPAPLLFVPMGAAQLSMAEQCGVLTYDPSAGVPYEVYSAAEGFGYVHAYDPAELVQAQAQSQLNWRDILVLSEAPLDITQVVSGVVSGSRQAGLSHLNVRSQARGTPSCYLRDADVLLSPWEGQLVRLVCVENQWLVNAAELEQAEAFWERLRPEPVDVPRPDPSTTEVAPLLTVPTDTAEQRAAAVARYGGKGSGLATLYQRYTGPQVSGVLVPFAWYLEFLDEGMWLVDLGDGMAMHSFAQTLDHWLDDPDFATDPAKRNERLAALRRAMIEASPAPARVEQLHERIVAQWGTDSTILRFRSSSNAEDSLHFSGAGLYESTSVCPADSFDNDEQGPSQCDPGRGTEIGIERGLVTVWASLWNTAAFEEREWYGIDHRQVAMAILVNDRTADERATMVAVTGNPTAPQDDRWLVNAQIGELGVVSNVPGIVPERVLLDVERGQLRQIIRVGPSSEVEDEQFVLSDADLELLASRLAQLEQVMPIDEPVPEGARVVWDTEWKVRADGSLLIKQARPLLLSTMP